MKTPVFICLLFLSLFLTAQKEYHRWYFGNQAGIDFTSGTAVAVTNGAMNSTDNPATMSDSVGNLLFYSNGVQVWSRNHVLMPNGSGFLGSNTAGHTATAIRKPGSTSLYYLFTLDAFASPNGLRYSVIDMNLNGGMGDVVSGQKNIVVLSVASEQVVPIVHANGKDIWIVTHPWNSTSFNSFLVTSAGVSSTPVVSTTGTARSGNSNNALGQITVNETNDRIAWALFGNDRFELFDFDNSTGVLSNPLVFNGHTKAWGLEFSPDGSKLYLTGWTTQYVSQFDLSTYTQAAISASEVNLGNVTGPGAPYFTGYLQRAPDGKIYLAVYLDPYLAVINNPNAAGLACNLVDNGYQLAGKVSGAGLPDKLVVTYTCSNFVSLGNDTTVCAGQTVVLDATTPASTYSWSNGSTNATINTTTAGTYSVIVSDTAGCVSYDTVVVTHTPLLSPFSLGADTTYCGNFNRVLTTSNPSTVWSTGATSAQITITSQGTYWATQTNQCNSVSDTIVLAQIMPPQFSLPNDTSLCPGDSMQLSVSSGSNIVWNTGSTSSSIWASNAGVYWAEAYNVPGCARRDSIVVSNLSLISPFSIGSDTTYCGSFNRVLIAGNPNTVWSTGTTSAQITVTSQGTYWATQTNQCNSVSDTIVLAQIMPPQFSLPNDTSLCPGDSMQLSVSSGSNIVWNTGSTSSSIWASNAGVYWAEAYNVPGCARRDSIVVSNLSLMSPFSIGSDTTYCGTFNRILITGNPNTVWSTGATAAQISITTPGTYWATQSNACNSIADTIVVSQTAIPVISLVADTGFCQGDSVLLSTGGAANILWSTGATSNSIYASTPGIYWVEGFNAPQCVVRDSVNVVQLTLPVFSLGADTSFCSSGGLTLDPAIAGAQYHWQDNSVLQQFTVTQSGTYSVTVTNACGSATDEINVDFRAGGCQLAIPTAFSPNGDGVNDLFKAVAFCPVAKFSMHVYNRWGELVYETDDVTEGWDGVFRRDQQPLGVFVYYIEYFNDCSQKIENVVGNVTLMR